MKGPENEKAKTILGLKLTQLSRWKNWGCPPGFKEFGWAPLLMHPSHSHLLCYKLSSDKLPAWSHDGRGLGRDFRLLQAELRHVLQDLHALESGAMELAPI